MFTQYADSAHMGKPAKCAALIIFCVGLGTRLTYNTQGLPSIGEPEKSIYDHVCTILSSHRQAVRADIFVF